MAEIKIEKKKPVWPWILIGLIILAVIFFMVFNSEDDEEFNDDELREVSPNDTMGESYDMEEKTFYL